MCHVADDVEELTTCLFVGRNTVFVVCIARSASPFAFRRNGHVVILSVNPFLAANDLNSDDVNWDPLAEAWSSALQK